MARQYEAEQGILRLYAKGMAIFAGVSGLLGLILGDESAFGVLNIDLMEDIIHLVSGGLLAYVGWANRDSAVARSIVGSIGVLYVLMGLLGFISPTFFGLMPHQLSVVDNLIHLSSGVPSIVIAWFVGSRR